MRAHNWHGQSCLNYAESLTEEFKGGVISNQSLTRGTTPNNRVSTQGEYNTLFLISRNNFQCVPKYTASNDAAGESDLVW